MSLEVRDLRVGYHTDAGVLQAVRGIDLDVAAGERVGLVGESGSGKTTVVSAVLGMLPRHATMSGTISVAGRTIDHDAHGRWDPATVVEVRGKRIAAVPQGAMAGLHPTHRVDEQVAEVIRVHTELGRSDAMDRARALLDMVGLDDRARRAFPHELSGGMRQRVALAAALACSPDVLIADEPTVGLDAITAARFLRLLIDRQEEDGFGLLVVSHDLPTVRSACDRLLVAYAGRIVEAGRTAEVASSPEHPYAIGLLRAAPTLDGGGWAAIPGTAPDLVSPPPGCAFAARCPAGDHHDCVTVTPVPVVLGSPNGDGRARRVECHLVDPGSSTTSATATAATLESAFPTVQPRRRDPADEPVVRMTGVGKTYRSRRMFRTVETPALMDVDVELRRGEILGLVGLSGSGKSTLARILFGLVTADTGSVLVDGEEVVGAPRRDLRRIRSRLALVHQDPYASLHPGMPVVDLVAEPLAIRGITRADRRERAALALALVGLDPSPDLLARRAGQLSGGQRQRVALARALVGDPVVAVLDEPMSMLDASVRAGIATALLDARDAVGLAAVVITHDLAEAAATCDRIAVLDEGRIVEQGPTDRLVSSPDHSATRRLFDLAADPTLGATASV